jgi:hypothetical protein
MLDRGAEYHCEFEREVRKGKSYQREHCEVLNPVRPAQRESALEPEHDRGE